MLNCVHEVENVFGANQRSLSVLKVEELHLSVILS